MGAAARGVGTGTDVTSDRRFSEALAAVASSLGELGRPWMLIGGVAVIARGCPRLTDDVDVAVWAPGISIGLERPEPYAEAVVEWGRDTGR